METAVQEFEYVSMEELLEESVQMVNLVVNELLVGICVKAKIKTLPKVKVTTNEEVSQIGGYLAGASLIRLNAVNLQGKGVREIAFALAHEVYHHKQWEDGERFENYIQPGENAVNYQAQQVEAEANAFAGRLFPA